MEATGRIPRLPPIPHPWVSSLQSPFYVTTWPRVSPEDEIERYLAAVRKWSEGVSTPWASVVDMSGFEASSSTAGQRRVFAEHAKPMVPFMEAYCAGIGVVSPSALIRGVVTAILWLLPPPIPVKMFAVADDATAWTQGLLEERARQLIPA